VVIRGALSQAKSQRNSTAEGDAMGLDDFWFEEEEEGDESLVEFLDL
jgi:hypothetical protein